MVSLRAILCALVISNGVSARPVKPPDDGVIKSNGRQLFAVPAPHDGLHSLQLLRGGLDEDKEDAQRRINQFTISGRDRNAPIPTGFSAGSVHGASTSSRNEESGRMSAPMDAASSLQSSSSASLHPASTGVRLLQSEEEPFSQMDVSMDEAQAEDPIIDFHRKFKRVLEPDKVQPHVASELVPMYSTYKQKYSGVPLSSMDSDKLRAANDDIIRERLLEMKKIIRALLHHSNTLQLDKTRAEYLERLQARLQEASQALSPTKGELQEQVRRNFYEQLSHEDPESYRSLVWFEEQQEQRQNRISAHRDRLNVDFDLVSKLEAEMEELLGRMTPAVHHLFRRSDLSGDSRDQRADHRSVHLQRREVALSAASSSLLGDRKAGNHGIVDDSGKRSHSDASLINLSPRRLSEHKGSLEGLDSIDEILQRIELTRDDRGAFAIADFLRRNQPLVPTNRVSPVAQRLLAAVYRRYQALHDVRGQNLNLQDRNLVTEQMLYSVGRNRFRNMLPVIQHMLDHQEALQLVGFRSNFLEAARERFRHMEVQLTPTVDELIGPADAGESFERLRRWFSNDFDDVPEHIRSRLHSRVHPMLHSPERVLLDLHFVKLIEQDLDGFVRRVEGRLGQGIHVVPNHVLRKRGDPSDSAGEASGSHEEAEAEPEASTSHGQPPVPAHSYESIWREPRTHETMTRMGLQWFDTGAIPIAEFWQLEQPLFPLIPRERQTLEDLASVYRPYQQAHPARGEAVDIEDDEVFDHDVEEANGRRKLRDIDAVLSHIIQNHDRLGLDRLRVDYIQALQHRFSLSSRLLTPTPKEVLDHGRKAVSSIQDGPSLLADLLKAASRTVESWNIRKNIGKSNLERFSLDFYLLNLVEKELDHLVKGVDTRLVTGRRLHLGKRDTPNPSNHQGPQNVPQQRETIDEALERLLMTRNDVGAIPITRFRVTNQNLVQPQHIIPQQLRQLAEVYRAYQEAIPVWGGALALRDGRLLNSQWLRSQSRDRFRHMQPILAYMIEQREPLRLDNVRVSYLRALQDRFRWTAEQMTTTFDLVESLSRATQSDLQLGEIYRLSQQLALRNADMARFGEHRLQRFHQDSIFDHVLEAEREQIVQPIAQYGSRAGPHARRAIIPDAGAEEKHPNTAKEAPAALRLIDLRPRSPKDPGLKLSSWPRTRPLFPINVVLRAMGMPQDEPGSEAIANHLRRNDPLLPLIRRAPTERRQLMSLYRNYQNLNPIRGQDLDLEDTSFFSNLLLDDVGRDRLRHMDPVLAYMLEHYEALGVNSVRKSFLQALQERFRESLDFLTPTMSDIKRSAEQELRNTASGKIMDQHPKIAARMASDMEQRMRRALDRQLRLMNDFSLMKYLEKELEAICDHAELVAGSRQRLFRRDRVPGGSPTQRLNPSLAGANSVPMVGQAQATDRNMQQILDPLGMNLADAHAQPIAVYRLSESALLENRAIPQHVESELRGVWRMHRQQYQPEDVYGQVVPYSVKLQRYVDTDEGERFGSANRIIKLVLDHETRLQLSPIEINYLKALQARFETTHEIMQPLPSTLAARVREAFPWVTPQEQQQRLHASMVARSAHIVNDHRNILIDSQLLRTFEIELGLLGIH